MISFWRLHSSDFIRVLYHWGYRGVLYCLYRCGNKFLEFLRSSAVMTDYQRIKLQEQDSNNAGSRIPRTFEVEVRGSLVNLCITGDLLTVVGIVKTIQVRSSLYVWVDSVDTIPFRPVNSLQCIFRPFSHYQWRFNQCPIVTTTTIVVGCFQSAAQRRRIRRWARSGCCSGQGERIASALSAGQFIALLSR